jgi:two-component system, LytTR family, sensor kinase
MYVPATRFRRILRDYLLSIAFWLTTSVLVAWQHYTLATAQQLVISLDNLFSLQAARYLSIALLTPPLFYIVERWPARSVMRATAYVLGFVPFSAAFAVIRWCLKPPWIEQIRSWGPRTLHTLVTLMYGTFADVLLVYLAVVLAAHAYTYFVIAQRQAVERVELRRALAQSELNALKIQLHPHFLFNTLQGISALIDTDGATAQRMLAKLAHLLRSALKHQSCDLVPFSEEIDFMKSYLELEAMRLGERLQIRWNITAAARNALIPQLILQPLLENAILHGVACSREGGWIAVEADCSASKLQVRVCNSVTGRSQSGLGLGISNTRSRLQYLFGDDATLDFGIAADGIATASVTVPGFAVRSIEPAHA